ncbi:MAG TPA: bifunctional aldolase/short-chain dehydrogenase [Xanthobacteraceae bacterium]|jgi:rhamnose utilization protein RhaD (predicted bifunctional aldolase and dehydrogenase)/NAD(P)-dependent dehydrogenase (short-subunit alcohol dehydrogenase family)
MKSGWVEGDADALVARGAECGIGRDLALLVYLTRLLGRDRKLVLHGGGNTSLKAKAADLFGEEADAIYVKASGADMAEIEPPGLPAVRLHPLRALRTRDEIADPELIAFERANLIDPAAPNPSVEIMLHAFLPQKFVAHTHARAVLSVIDQSDGEQKCGEVFHGRLAFVPYLMPGFGLAKKAIDVFEQARPSDGLILGKHGIVTFGADAREAYERMIEMVTLAETFLQRNTMAKAAAVAKRDAQPTAAIAPIVRGVCSQKDDKIEGAWRRMVLEFRGGDAIWGSLAANLDRLSKGGVVTPDHTIRTKNWPLVLPHPERGELADFEKAARNAAEKFVAHYRDYFARHNKRSGGGKRALDPLPRVVLIPGFGLFGLGATKSDAIIAADIAEEWMAVVGDAERTGRFESISESEVFDMEYWPLEQAKLGARIAAPLSGQIAVVTGAGGAIGRATAAALARAGAEVAALDIDLAAASETAKAIGPNVLAIECDVTAASSVQTAFDRVAETFGGLDILIANAGAAWQGRIGEVDENVLRRSFELNFYGQQRAAQAAIKIMLAQKTGGCLLFNVSKQAVNPGADFGPYGIPKAALMALMRQYAVDYGTDGIRANAVNADRIRSGLLTEDFIKQRAKARGVSEKDYMSGNLLGREVTADDVAQAFVHLALELKTTASVTTVDGGNIAAALR